MTESENHISGTSVLLMHTGTEKAGCKCLMHTVKDSPFPSWALAIQMPSVNTYAEISTQKENLK